MDKSPRDCFDLLSDLMMFDTLIGSGRGFGQPEARLEANLSTLKPRWGLPSQDTCKQDMKNESQLLHIWPVTYPEGISHKGWDIWWETSALGLKLLFILLPTLPQHMLSLNWNFNGCVKWSLDAFSVFPPRNIGMLLVPACQMRAVDMQQANNRYFIWTQTSLMKALQATGCCVWVRDWDPDTQICQSVKVCLW